MGLFYYLAIFLFTLSCFSTEIEELKNFSESREWHKLMHYRNYFGSIKTFADGEKFFMAKDGMTNPYSELLANLKAFNEPKENYKENEHPQCLFPIRYQVLKDKFPDNLKNSKDIECPDYEEWIGKLNPTGLSIVYANNFPNNPASTFGHTFLKIITAKDSYVQKGYVGGRKLDLLDYYIGYAAVKPPEDNVLVYVFKGIFGLYPGQFDLGPYYIKVNEYSNMESRDLWEYVLNFNAEETRKLLGHLWELGKSTYFDYYFFDENCSLHILSLIEVVKPDWELTNKFTFFVPPPETVKVVSDIPGAIRETKYRPSYYKRMVHKYNSLSSNQRLLYEEYLDGEIDAKKVEDPYVAETLNTFYAFLKKSSFKDFKGKVKEKSTEMLVQRSKLPIINDNNFDNPKRPKNPMNSHGNMLLSLGGGVNKTQSFNSFSFRTEIHDILNDDTGMPEFTTIEFFRFYFRYYNQKRNLKEQFQLDRFDLINIMSLFPITQFESKFSYHAQLGIESLRELSCSECQFFRIRPRGGYSFKLIDQTLLSFFMIGLNADLANRFNGNSRYGPMLTIGTHLKLDQFKSIFRYSAVMDIDQKERPDTVYEGEWESAFLFSKNFELRLLIRYWHFDSGVRPTTYENSLSLNYSF